MYLISVYFDDKSNKIISNYINKIAQKTGNTFMTDNDVPPHLTIMSVEAREEKKLTEVMEQLERSLTKGQIQLVSVGVLLPYVLYAAPVLNLYLEAHSGGQNEPVLSAYAVASAYHTGKEAFKRTDAGSIFGDAGTVCADGSDGGRDRTCEDESASGSDKSRIK